MLFESINVLYFYTRTFGRFIIIIINIIIIIIKAVIIINMYVNLCITVQIDNGGQIILKAAVDHLAQCPGFKDQKVLDKVTVACATLSAGKTRFIRSD
jgi:hypothetical protein